MDDRIRRLVAAHLPGYAVGTVRRLGAGQENVAYVVNDELVVRLANDPSAVSREADLLAAVAEFSPLPVPAPMFVDADGGCLAYRKLPGVPMLDLPPSARASLAASVAAQLGGFLAALHATPPARMASLVERDDQPLPDWLIDAAADYHAIAQRIPHQGRGPIEAFLAAAPPQPAPTLVFSHNDLGIEHILLDAATGDVSGVIDWSDAAITDGAYDLGLILRDLGPIALDAALAAYGPADALFRERAVFYARCAMLEDLRYGVEAERPAYVDKSLGSLPWLFAA